MKSNLREKGVYLSLEFQGAFHHCWEIKAGTSVPFTAKSRGEMRPYTLNGLLLYAQLGFSSLT